jgi:hypothetical protein
LRGIIGHTHGEAAEGRRGIGIQRQFPAKLIPPVIYLPTFENSGRTTCKAVPALTSMPESSTTLPRHPAIA